MIYIDIHGYRSGPDHIWHPKLKDLIDKSGNTVVAPQLPGDAFPVFTEWLKIINNCYLEYQGQEVCLMGHSLGTRAVLLYLDKYRVKVSKIILIAPFNNDTENAKFRDGAYANFFENRVRIEEITELVKTRIVIGSKDDSRIPYHQAEEISKDLDAKLITIPDSDHFLKDIWAEKLWEEISN